MKNLVSLIWVFTVFLWVSSINPLWAEEDVDAGPPQEESMGSGNEEPVPEEELPLEEDMIFPQDNEEDYPEGFRPSDDDPFPPEPDAESAPISDSDVVIN